MTQFFQSVLNHSVLSMSPRRNSLTCTATPFLEISFWYFLVWLCGNDEELGAGEGWGDGEQGRGRMNLRAPSVHNFWENENPSPMLRTLMMANVKGKMRGSPLRNLWNKQQRIFFSKRISHTYTSCLTVRFPTLRVTLSSYDTRLSNCKG